MNISVISGILLAMIAAGFVAHHAHLEVGVLLNMEGITIVIGGTIATGLMIFSYSQFWNMLKVFVLKVILNKGVKPEQVIGEILTLSRGLRNDSSFMKSEVRNIKTPFLRDGVEMLNKGGIPFEEIESIMRKRLNFQYQKYEEEAETFKTLSRFPPAFGLMGTTFGMISLMRSLGGEGSFDKIGPAMGIALVATLYGIGIANLILIPFGERLARLNQEDATTKAMVLDGLKLLHAKTHPLIVEEHLLSFMLPGARGDYNRNKLKKVA